MTKTGLLLFSVAVAIFIVVGGCSTTPDHPDNKTTSPQQGHAAKKGGYPKPRTVAGNKGTGKTQGDQGNTQSTQPATPRPKGAKDAVLAAAQDYYAAAATGNYHYTYNALSSYSRSQFTESEWVADNVALGSDAGKYAIDSVRMIDPATAEVHLTIISADGSSSERTTRFVLENGGWKHDLTQEEYDLFAGATATATATATASSSSSSSASPSASPNPSPNRNYNAPNPNAPERMSRGACLSKGGHPVTPGTDGDGDTDGCAGE